ncbi:MAG: ABC transporter substrate-binding protein [Chlorobiales bacterium]|nr:ABC transporter substrate-binding protein [Chlorobiales bacterium]
MNRFPDKYMLAFLFMSALLSLAGCGKTDAESSKNDINTIRVTDFRGKTVALNKPASRIVCLIESGLSGLYMLGVEDKVVGVPSSVYKESVALLYASLDDRIKEKKLPSPGNWDFVSLEQVVALQPDLVIMWASQQESIEAIEEKGIPVYGVFLKSFKDAEKEIRDFGILTGKESRADSLINYTKNEVQRVQTTIPDAEKKTVYFMWAQGLLETSGKMSTANELIELAGAKNVCTADEEHLVVNMERVLEWNPDVIVMWWNAAKNPEDVLGLSEWQNIKAVKQKTVYELPSAFYCDFWTLKYQYAVKLLAKSCYPEKFKDLDLEKERRDMLVTLYGQKGLKLTE